MKYISRLSIKKARDILPRLRPKRKRKPPTPEKFLSRLATRLGEARLALDVVDRRRAHAELIADLLRGLVAHLEDFDHLVALLVRELAILGPAAIGEQPVDPPPRRMKLGSGHAILGHNPRRVILQRRFARRAGVLDLLLQRVDPCLRFREFLLRGLGPGIVSGRSRRVLVLAHFCVS